MSNAGDAPNQSAISIAMHLPFWNGSRMFGRLLLTASAIFLAILGLAGLFAPDEIESLLDRSAPPTLALALQLAAGGLLGFAMLNWMSRRNRIGGIYGRPLGVGNLLLFAVGASSLGKAAVAGTAPAATIPLTALFALLAAAFAWLVFVHDPLSRAEAR